MKLRFDDAPSFTKTRTPTNQIGPDDQAEIVYRDATYNGLFARSVDTGQGLIALSGATSGTVKLTKDVALDQLVGKKMYSYLANTNHTVNGNTAGNAGDVITVSFTPALAVEHSNNAVVFADVDGPFRFVSKSGSDANTGASPWTLKLTIQAAIDSAVADNATRVYILDSGVYDERLDLKGITVEAASGQSPTIRYPITGWTGAATVGGHTVYGFAEFTMSGVPYVWAATRGGLYRSVDGITWDEYSGITDDLRGCAVWQGYLWYTDYDNNRLAYISSTGTIAYISAATIGATTIDSGLFPAGNILLMPSLSDDAFYFYDGTTWDRVATQNMNTVSFGYTTGNFITASSNGLPAVINLADNYSIQAYAGIDISSAIVYATGGQHYALDKTYLYRFANLFDVQQMERLGAHGVTNPTGITSDPRGWMYIFGASNYAISRDNGRTWYTYGTAPAAKAVYAPAIFFRGVGLVAKTTDIAYEDMVHIRNSTGNGNLYGAYLQGTKSSAQAIEMTRADILNPAFGYVHASNYYIGSDFRAVSLRFHFNNSIACNMSDFCIDVAEVDGPAVIFDISGTALKYSDPENNLINMTIIRCGVGYNKTGYNGGIENSIIYGNVIDILTENTVDEYTVIDSIVGSFVGGLDSGESIGVRSYPLLLPDGSYMDTYSGYPLDSVAKDLNAGARKYAYSAVLNTPVTRLLDYLPVRISLQYKASNFTSNENASGDYSESWDGMKRQITLTWQDDSWSTPIEYHRIVDMLKLEDRALLFGKADNAGDWMTQLNTVPTLEASTDGTLVTRTLHPVCGINEWAGWYLKVYDSTTMEDLYLRIISNTEGDGSSAVTFVVAWFPAGASIAQGATLQVVYLPVKIDKSGAFSATQYGYVSTPYTGYSLVLREVEL